MFFRLAVVHKNAFVTVEISTNAERFLLINLDRDASVDERNDLAKAMGPQKFRELLLDESISGVRIEPRGSEITYRSTSD